MAINLFDLKIFNPKGITFFSEKECEGICMVISCFLEEAL